MHFGFALESLDIDLWNIDFLDTHLDLLDTDIPSKHFVCLQDVLKTSSRYVFKTSSRHVFKTSSRRLQNVLEDVKLLRWRCVEDVFKTCLEDVFKTDIFKTNKCLLGQKLKILHSKLQNLSEKYKNINSSHFLKVI